MPPCSCILAEQCLGFSNLEGKWQSSQWMSLQHPWLQRSGSSRGIYAAHCWRYPTSRGPPQFLFIPFSSLGDPCGSWAPRGMGCKGGFRTLPPPPCSFPGVLFKHQHVSKFRAGFAALENGQEGWMCCRGGAGLSVGAQQPFGRQLHASGVAADAR